MSLRIALLLPFMFTAACASMDLRKPDSPGERFAAGVRNDYLSAYRAAELRKLLVPLAAAGTLANTRADRSIREHWQANVRGELSNELGRIFLEVGDAGQNKISLPFYTLTMLAADYSGVEAEDHPVATWAARSARANLVGGPQAWVLTYALGSHRPGVGESDWAPWRDNDGVSGHAFYGAVPLLTAGHMAEHPGWRYTLYALSVLPAVSRINNDQHYSSQVVMGWSIAWLSTRRIARDEEAAPLAAYPLPGGGVLLSYTVCW